MSKLKLAYAYLELLRAKLLPTVWFDVAAGFLLAGGRESSALPAPLVLASTLYLFGMVTNDIFDLKRDRNLYPDRPLPSGRISPAGAWCAAALLLMAAAVVSPLLPWESLVAGAFIFSAALAYNLGVKRIPVFGPLIMGSCRSADLLLGASAAGSLPGESIEAASALGLFVAVVTVISQWEGKEISLVRLRGAVGVLLLFPVWFFARAKGPVSIAAAALFAILVLLSMPASPFRLARPEEKTVRRLLGGIYLADGFFIARGGNVPAAVLALGAGVLHVFTALTALPAQREKKGVPGP